MDESATYACPHCGEPVETTLDPSAARRQRYVEDCPVCCRPIVVFVSFDEEGRAAVAAEAE
jgi:hypothetical protein